MFSRKAALGLQGKLMQVVLRFIQGELSGQCKQMKRIYPIVLHTPGRMPGVTNVPPYGVFSRRRSMIRPSEKNSVAIQVSLSGVLAFSRNFV
ncbi:MAG: hypothetical protein PVF73_12700 [Bacteroidales bacterium]|jgi:hypothetical protein